MTIERLAEAPLILYDARWGADDPMRRQLRERAQRAGVKIEPDIEVEYLTAALDLARAASATRSPTARSCSPAAWRGAWRACRSTRRCTRRSPSSPAATPTSRRPRGRSWGGRAPRAALQRRLDAERSRVVASAARRGRPAQAPEQPVDQRAARPRRAPAARTSRGNATLRRSASIASSTARASRRGRPPAPWYQAGIVAFSWACSSLTISPGKTVVTETPVPASSWRSASAKPRWAALVAP